MVRQSAIGDHSEAEGVVLKTGCTLTVNRLDVCTTTATSVEASCRQPTDTHLTARLVSTQSADLSRIRFP
jgi:hypothetical protein